MTIVGNTFKEVWVSGCSKSFSSHNSRDSYHSKFHNSEEKSYRDSDEDEETSDVTDS